MAGVELGTYYVSVTPSTRGITSGLQGELAGVSREIGGISGALTKIGGSLAVAKIGRDAVTAGGALEKSRDTLSGLYQNAGLASDTMSSLRDIARDSSLSFQSYEGAATALAYIGVNGPQAVKILDNVGKAIVGAGGDSTKLEQATDALTKMQSAGKVTLDAIQQLSASGVPILSALQAHFGVTREQVNQMATEGKIGIEDVTTSLEQGLGEWFPKQIAAANQVEKGFAATWARMSDEAKTSLGEAVLPLLQTVTPALDVFADVVQAIPKPIMTIAVGFGAAAATSAVFQAAVARNTLGIGTLTGVILENATASGIATAASSGFAAAMTREAEAASAAAAANGANTATRGGLLGVVGNSKLTTRIGLTAAALYGVGKAGGWLNDKLHGSRPSVEDMADALKTLGETGQETGAMLREHGGLDDLTKSIKEFKANTDGVDGAINKTTDVLAKIGTLGAYSGHSSLDNLTKDINTYDEALAQLVQSGDIDLAKAAFKEIESHLRGEGLSDADVKHFFNDYLAAAGEVPPTNDAIAGSLSGTAGGMRDLSGTIEDQKKRWADWVDENGAVAALKKTYDQAADLKSILDDVAGAAARALGEQQAPDVAQDAYSKAVQEYSSALAEARADGYQGDPLDMNDQSKVAIDLRDKYRDVQSAAADLTGAWVNAGASSDQLQWHIIAMGEEFKRSVGKIDGSKSSVDNLNGSMKAMIWNTQIAINKWKELAAVAERDSLDKVFGIERDSSGRVTSTQSSRTNPGEWVDRLPGHATGGRVRAGELYRVNETNTELFQPDMSGMVIPIAPSPGPGGSDRAIIVNVINPVAEPASTSIPRAGRELAAAIGGS